MMECGIAVLARVPKGKHELLETTALSHTSQQLPRTDMDCSRGILRQSTHTCTRVTAIKPIILIEAIKKNCEAI